jgi:hypothetical protein
MERFFFVHVQKTGGTTLWMHVRENFPIEAVYPNRFDDADLFSAYLDIDYITSLPPERVDRIRCFAGHVPYFVTELLGGNFVTMTVLRDPVERVLSFLQDRQRMQAQQGTSAVARRDVRRAPGSVAVHRESHDEALRRATGCRIPHVHARRTR